MERDLKILYEILLEECETFIIKKTRILGICSIIPMIYMSNQVTEKEFLLLAQDFKTRKPKWYSKFYWYHLYKGKKGYWFELSDKGDEQRKEFIKHIIKKL
jgi:hypothetical protein